MAARFSRYCLILLLLLCAATPAFAGAKDTFLSGALPGEPRPTILFLHGGNSIGPKFSSYIAINRELARRGVVGIYPSGMRGHWNDGRGGSPRNDVKYLDSLIDFYVAQKIIDPTRLYLAGLSNGGMMAFGMLCGSGYQFKGVAIVGATFPRSSPKCSKIKPAPTMVVWGSEDKYFPPDGTPGNSWHGNAGVATRAETIAFLKAANGCKSDVLPMETDELPTGLRVRMRAYKDCAQPLQVYDYLGTGHVWPGAGHSYLMQKMMGPNPKGFPVNDLILKTWFGG